MILQSLHDLYDRLAADPSYEIAKPGYSPQKISFRVVIKPDGSLFSISSVADNTQKKPFVNHTVPEHQVRSGTKILPQFLCDKASYCLGVDTKSGEITENRKQFDSFRVKHLNVENEIACDQYSSLCRFLESWDAEKLNQFRESHPDIFSLCINFGIFEIQGSNRPIHESPAVIRWWDRQLSRDGPVGQCLITGENLPIARLHPKIKGFASAAALVGVQKGTSYESYGLEQGFTSQTSEIASFKYAAALNWLLDGQGRQKHRTFLADTTCVFWTDQPSIVEDIGLQFFSSGSDIDEAAQDQGLRSKIEILIKAMRQGNAVLTDIGENPDETEFFILGMEQPNPGRFAIRFFYRSSVSELLKNLQAHYAAISIIREYEGGGSNGENGQPEFLSNRDLINQTALKLSSGKLDYNTIPPLLGGSLMRSILENIPYPEGIYSAVIRRIRADRTINYSRAAIIKGTLVRNHNQTIPVMLDLENTEPAYLLGRLFATLEKIQEEGHTAQTGGKLDSTIRDKYLSSACATPSAVFPRLETLSTHHRRHLNPGRKAFFDKLVGEIKWNQSSTKSTHTLKEQGMFILGYYHQRKALFTAKEKTEQNSATTEQSA
jgi:CRISPR-associated protein Csd1